MPSTADEFFEEFDDITNRVVRARNESFPQLLRRWFATLYEAPNAIADRVRWLEGLSSWEQVEAEVLKPGEGMVGSGEMAWPEDKVRRLSSQLILFKHLSNESADHAWNFASDYFATKSNNIDDILHGMTEHLFDDHASELRRYMQRNLNEPLPIDAIQIPAADRVVPINHNTSEYRDTVEKLGEIQELVRGNNLIDEIEKDRLLFELRSGALLFHAQTVRAEAVYAVLVSALKYLAREFAGQSVGLAAGVILTMVLRMLGLPL